MRSPSKLLSIPIGNGEVSVNTNNLYSIGEVIEVKSSCKVKVGAYARRKAEGGQTDKVRRSLDD